MLGSKATVAQLNVHMRLSAWLTYRSFAFEGTDEWSIHKGSCNYGALWRDEPHGWDVSCLVATAQH